MLSSLAGVLFDGFAYGMLLFLLSVGLSVTLGMMNFVNLAHCSFAMVGGYVTVSLANQMGWPFLATTGSARGTPALESRRNRGQTLSSAGREAKPETVPRPAVPRTAGSCPSGLRSSDTSAAPRSAIVSAALTLAALSRRLRHACMRVRSAALS